MYPLSAYVLHRPAEQQAEDIGMRALTLSLVALALVGTAPSFGQLAADEDLDACAAR